MLQQGGLFGKLDEHLAVRGGGGGDGALDQQPAHAVFQRLDPLRYRRGRDAQGQRSPLEAALAHDGGQRAQVPMIDFHVIRFT
ncbi:hypothetical protein D3C72_1552020 [compost metagenome]